MRMVLELKGCAKLSCVESRGTLLREVKRQEEKCGRDKTHAERITLVSGSPVPV